METLIKDIRYGVRGLLKRPGFTVIALITLALGIGANTAIFSVVNAVLLRPLQFKDPEQLVIVWEDATFAGFPRNTPAPGNYFDWKNQNQSFADMAASAETSFNITGDGEPERVMAFTVTENFFPLFGVQPLLGRNFLPEEDRPAQTRSSCSATASGNRVRRRSADPQPRDPAQRRKAHGRRRDARELSIHGEEKFGYGCRSRSIRKTWRIAVATT